MKRLVSVILAVLLVAAVTGSTLKGTVAGFSDTEVSEENYLCAGTVNLEISGDYLSVNNAVPSKWYSMEKVLINAGSLDATASVHISNLVSIEDAPGAGVATSEPELVAEEGGMIGQKWVEGLGVDTCNIADVIDVKLWYDSDDDGVFELVDEGKLSDIACTTYELGVIPGNLTVVGKGGGWGSYFEYTIGTPKVELPLMIGQNTNGGTASVWTESGYLWVSYDTTVWEMSETAVYVGTNPPAKLAPGGFPYKHDPVTPPLTKDSYYIPLTWSKGDKVYIACHAAGIDNETAWARGTMRRFKIEVHLPDIPEGDLWLHYFDENNPDEVMWDHWPTNAYQGDIARFDTEFTLNGLSGDNGNGGHAPTCRECEGGVTWLELQYNGASTASIEVKSKKGAVLFSGLVNPDDTFKINGTGKDGKLGSEIEIWVDGEVATNIHTSCSQPIGPGLIRGDFEVIAGESSKGGALCPVPGIPECRECKGGVTWLELKYNGASTASIEVKSKKGAVLFSGLVNPDDTFKVNGTGKDGKLGSEIEIWVDGEVATNIHTSCSQPIGPGLIRGDFEVIAGESSKGGVLCPVPE